MVRRVVTVGKYGERLLGLTVTGQVELAEYILVLMVGAVYLHHGERLILKALRRVLGAHGPFRELVKFVLQEDVATIGAALQLPVEPCRQHAGKAAAVLTVEVAAMTCCQVVGKSSKHVVDACIVLHSIAVGHVALAARHI